MNEIDSLLYGDQPVQRATLRIEFTDSDPVLEVEIGYAQFRFATGRPVLLNDLLLDPVIVPSAWYAFAFSPLKRSESVRMAIREPYAYLDIGPIAGDRLLTVLLRAIGHCAPELGRSTVITNGGRPLALLAPPPPQSKEER